MIMGIFIMTICEYSQMRNLLIKRGTSSHMDITSKIGLFLQKWLIQKLVMQ